MRRNSDLPGLSGKGIDTPRSFGEDRYRPAKVIMRIIAVVGLTIGIMLLITGFNQETNADMDQDNWFEEGSAGGLKIFLGIIFISISWFLLLISFVGSLSRYQANETSEAMGIAGESV